MSIELANSLIIGLLLFSGFILLIVYVNNKIYEIREEVVNSKIRNLNKVMIRMLEQCKHESGREFCLDVIMSYNSRHDEKLRDAVQLARHLQNRRLKEKEYRDTAAMRIKKMEGIKNND